MELVTSRCVSPTYCASVRSTSTLKPGLFGLLDARVGDAGDQADAAQQLVAYLKLPSALAPRTWMSIGAGAPKLRIG